MSDSLTPLGPPNKDRPSESTSHVRSAPYSYLLIGLGLIVAVGVFVGLWIRPLIPSTLIPVNPSAFQATAPDSGLASMVLVPAGEFIMGSHQDGRLALKDEWPTHPVYLDAFYIDQYEVATGHYAKFFQETKRLPPKYWSEQILKQHERKPVVGVDWDEAAAYCLWLGKRLPTEAEWEKAARGTDQRLYPWGSVESSRQWANIDRCCKFNDYGVLTNVGSFQEGKSPYGVYDMAGNVWEWVADWYDGDYYGKSPRRNPAGPSRGEKRVLRGGAWDSAPVYARSAYRLKVSPKFRLDNIGFRCARDVQK